MVEFRISGSTTVLPNGRPNGERKSPDREVYQVRPMSLPNGRPTGISDTFAYEMSRLTALPNGRPNGEEESDREVPQERPTALPNGRPAVKNRFDQSYKIAVKNLVPTGKVTPL